MTNNARDIFHGEKGIFAGMVLCLERQCVLSTLVLAYSAIDNLSWLSLPTGKAEITRQHFMSWTDRYVLPNTSLECSSADLYGARCGLIHTLTPDSRMAEQGNAVKINYSWGNQPAYPRKKLEELGMSAIKIHVDTLCRAIEQGAQRFWEDVEKDKDRLSLLNQRAQKFLGPDPNLPPTLP
mgnify:CR=1 FL=1